MPTIWPLVQMESFSFHSPEHIMKDTVYPKAKFELDNGIGMAARGQLLYARVLVPLGAEEQRRQEGSNWLIKKSIPARRHLVEQDRDG